MKLKSLMGKILVVLLFITTHLPLAYGQERIELSSDILAESLETEGVLRVGMEANYAPFNWSQPSDDNKAYPIVNSDNEFANGYDVQIAKYLADTFNLKLEIVKLEWDGLPLALEAGKIDAIVAGMSPTEERKKQIDFSDNYYTSDMVVVVKRENPYSLAKKLADLSGARITGQLNTFHYDLINQIPGVEKQTAMDSFPTMISSVLADKIDGYLSESAGAMGVVASNPELTYITFEDGFDLGSNSASLAVGLRKNSKLTPYFNQALQKLTVDDHQALMQEMIDLNLANESSGFWSEVSRIWNEYKSQFIYGAAITMLIAIVTTIAGFLIGLVVGIIRSIEISKQANPFAYYLHKFIDFLLQLYIEVFRGTPMMVQAMLIFYGSKLFLNIDMSSLNAAFIIVSINTGAYLSEIIRGGINSIDKGQWEGAKAIGMNHVQTMSLVILPQTIWSILPAIANEFVINIKDSAVLSVIAVTELFFVTRSAAGSTYLIFQSFLIASIIYLILTFTTTRIINLFEKKLSVN